MQHKCCTRQELPWDAQRKFAGNAILAEHWKDGGKGASKLAEAVVEIIETKESKLKFLYDDNDKPKDNIFDFPGEGLAKRHASKHYFGLPRRFWYWFCDYHIGK